MVDTLSRVERSHRMSLVRGRDTKPELLVRSLLHRMGYRFRLHQHGLPGHPDIVMRKYMSVVFVHGCFWHRHPDKNCKLARFPKSRLDFWKPKLESNRVRDLKNQEELIKAGWRVFVVWECQLNDIDLLATRLKRSLERGE